MKKFSVLIILLIVLVIVLVSCSKEKQSFCVNALVRWGGSPAADGLGWYLIVDSTRGISYVPKNLPDNFKVNDLVVNVCLYETNERITCQCVSPPNKYQITSIRKL